MSKALKWTAGVIGGLALVGWLATGNEKKTKDDRTASGERPTKSENPYVRPEEFQAAVDSFWKLIGAWFTTEEVEDVIAEAGPSVKAAMDKLLLEYAAVVKKTRNKIDKLLP